MKKVAVVGSLNVDLVVHTPVLPRVGQTVIGYSFMRFPGGKGANQSVGIARLGGHVFHIGKLGNDDSAQLLRESLKVAGVLLDGLLEDHSCETGVALIQLEDSGANSIIVVPGANMNLRPSDLDAFLPIFRETQIILLQNEIPLETNLKAAFIGRESGAIVAYNPAPFREGSQEICSLANLIVLNEIELSQLSGSLTEENMDLGGAAAKLLDVGNADAVIVTLGDRGSIVKSRKSIQSFPAYRVRTKDTTAAGDAFIAGLIFSISLGKDLREAVQFGSKAAAYAVTVIGAQSSLPSGEQLEKFMFELEGG